MRLTCLAAAPVATEAEAEGQPEEVQQPAGEAAEVMAPVFFIKYYPEGASSVQMMLVTGTWCMNRPAHVVMMSDEAGFVVLCALLVAIKHVHCWSMWLETSVLSHKLGLAQSEAIHSWLVSLQGQNITDYRMRCSVNRCNVQLQRLFEISVVVWSQYL